MPDQSSTSKSKPASSMAELMARQSTQVQPLKKGDIVEGTVKSMTPQEILLEIGGKGDALVLEYDRRNLENLLNILHVGDVVRASVISAESEQGFPVVSLRRTLDDLIFERLGKRVSNNEIVTVRVTESTRGGYFADSDFGIQGFLPNSQVLSTEDLSGHDVEVKIIEFDRAKKRVIFSQKAVEYVTDITEIEKHIKKGDTVAAVIDTITPYGAYVTIRPATSPQSSPDKRGSSKGVKADDKDVKIEGFVHISEVSHSRVENLESLYKKGEKLSVQVLEIDRENRRVNLSLKALLKDAFTDAAEKYKPGSEVRGTVSDVKSRGVTMTLGDEIRAFIPSNKVPTGTTYEVGQTVTAEVTDIDEKRRVVVVSPVLKKTSVSYR